VKIEDEIARSGDVEMLQDLVMAAVNEAGRKVDQEMQGALGGMMGGLGGLGL
jgi:DNA-binding protein YbaB